MQPTDVNARIAKEVMGWEPVPYSAERWRMKHGQERDLPDFANSLDACALAESEIEKRGLMSGYRRILVNEVGKELCWEADTLQLWLIRLTPAQRCAAMLKAVANA